MKNDQIVTESGFNNSFEELPILKDDLVKIAVKNSSIKSKPQNIDSKKSTQIYSIVAPGFEKLIEQPDVDVSFVRIAQENYNNTLQNSVGVKDKKKIQGELYVGSKPEKKELQNKARASIKLAAATVGTVVGMLGVVTLIGIQSNNDQADLLREEVTKQTEKVTEVRKGILETNLSYRYDPEFVSAVVEAPTKEIIKSQNRAQKEIKELGIDLDPNNTADILDYWSQSFDPEEYEDSKQLFGGK